MNFGRVLGTVVCTLRVPSFRGQRLLLVQPTDTAGTDQGRALVADEGNTAAQVLRRGRGAVRTVIVGVVDEVSTG